MSLERMDDTEQIGILREVSALRAENAELRRQLENSVALPCAPAADVAEVKRGHWIEDGSVQICSECGEEHEWGEYRATYCEDCGARMDGADSG